MLWLVSDRLLWTTVILGGAFACYYIPTHLAFVAQITEVPEATAERGPNKQLRSDAERAISLETLRVLSDGYSHDIRTAAIKIVANRTLKSKTKYLILRDLASKEDSKRSNAIRALRLLFYDQNLTEKTYIDRFADYQTLKAIIAALRNVLDKHKPFAGDDVETAKRSLSPVKPSHRPPFEEPLLTILHDVLNSRSFQSGPNPSDLLDMALRAGLVSKWLTNYPFPCSLAENRSLGLQKSDVVKLLCGPVGANGEAPWSSDDPVMATLVGHIMDFSQGNDALCEAGLHTREVAPNFNFRSNGQNMPFIFGNIAMVNGESITGASTSPEMRHLLASARGDDRHSHANLGSSETEDLRRRHREAIVIVEAGFPLRHEHILQRQYSEPTLETTMGTDDSESPPIELDEQEIDLGGPIAIPDQPWDLRRQEIEGEAIVNESIREAALHSRDVGSSEFDHSATEEPLNEADAEN